MALRIDIPGRRVYEIEHVILDLNGTLARDGELLEGVAERIGRLSGSLHLILATADTFGQASSAGKALGVETVILGIAGQAEQKREIVRRLGPDRTLAVGNGSNDVLMLEESAIGVCVVGAEGASSAAVMAANVVVTDVRDALDLLIWPQRLVATLRQ